MWNRIGRKYLWHNDTRAMGTRREGGGNLTERIAKSSTMTALMIAENQRIARQYAPLDGVAFFKELLAARPAELPLFQEQIRALLKEKGIE
jgi:hypothetical protein